MPWSNQSGGSGGTGGGSSGGPWGGGSGSGGSGNGGGRGPWGNGPSGGGNTPPDLEDLIRRGGDRLKSVLPGGGGNLGGRGVAFIIAGLVIAWALTGWYRVQPNEVGVNMVFGRFTSISPPGLNYNWPTPIGSVARPKVTQVNSFDVGTTDRGGGNSDSLVLTGDENLVDINFTVQWQIDPATPQNYLFNTQDPEGTVRAVAESAMRESIGRRDIQPILTTDRQAIETEVLELMQRALDSYKTGVKVLLVQLQRVDPPQQVIDAFRDQNAALADQVRLQNEAQTYANRVVPEARGQAARITQSAEAYRDQMVAEATGQASRFTQIYREYKNAPAVTRERMYLETMESILAGADKMIVDSKGGPGVVPYLPLNGFSPRAGGRPANTSAGPSTPSMSASPADTNETGAQ